MTPPKISDRKPAPWLTLCAMLAFACPAGLGAASAEDSLTAADRQAKDGNNTAAAKAYESFIKTNPEHSQIISARYRLGKCYEDLGKIEEAIEQYNAVGGADAKFRGRNEALFALGKLLASLKRHEEAIKAIEKLLAAGGGLYEEDSHMLLGGYYAILSKWDDAAAHFNILRRRESTQAPTAAYKLALLWLRAEKLDDAVQAINFLAEKWPSHANLPELLISVASLNRQKGKLDVALGLCEQIKTRFPSSQEAAAAEYLQGLCLSDRKDFAGAVKVLDGMSRYNQPSLRGLAGEGLVLSAQIWGRDLKDRAKALQRYEEAAQMVREIETPRRTEILEHCWFQLAEDHFQKKNWAAALDFYLMLRQLGTKINIFGRIIACQEALGDKARPDISFDDQYWKDIVEKNPGTLMAAEAEIALADQKLGKVDRTRDPRRPESSAPVAALASEYQRILKTYTPVLNPDLVGYCHSQVGYCLSASATKEGKLAAIAAYEKAISAVPEKTNRYRVPSLEVIARISESIGDLARARAIYRELLQIARAMAGDDQKNVKLQEKTNDYLKGMITRVDTEDAVKAAIEDTQKLIDEAGPLSDIARSARYYLAELHYLRKDFAAAAKAWKDFIKTYGPPQDASGDFTTAFVPVAEEKTEQIQSAAARIAHAWCMQGHDQNMLAAYQWLVKNLADKNRWMPEAEYWLAMELGKGKKGETKEGKKALAETLWTKVVCKTTDPTAFAKNWHPWVSSTDDNVVRYIRAAMMRAGQSWSEIEDNERAAAVFEHFLQRFEIDFKRLTEEQRLLQAQDDQLPVARYALGLAYHNLGDLTRMTTAWKPYLEGHREPNKLRFRISALKMLGVEAGKAEKYQVAVDAYAVLLDEYGLNPINPTTQKPVPIPMEERLYKNRSWDGIRQAVPKGLDQGEIRFNLGVLYFKHEAYALAALALKSFESDPDLAANASRDRALFMAGQSLYKTNDFPKAGKVLSTLLRDHPKFPALEEVAVWAGRAWVEAKNWKDFDAVLATFRSKWANSDWRTRMDLLHARSLLGRGQIAEGQALLKSLAKADTYEDVKADAAYQLGMFLIGSTPANYKEAMPWFDQSIATYPRDQSLFDAARCAKQLGNGIKARDLCGRLLKDFPKSPLVQQCGQLLVEIQKDIAKTQSSK